MRASAPGKLLLAGEYAVLSGGPAVVMAVNRRAVADARNGARGGLAESLIDCAPGPYHVQAVRDTIADPDAAYTITKTYVEGLADDALEQEVLAATIELWQAERLGYSQPASWETMQQTLLDAGLLAAPQDLSKTYTNEFIP